MEQLCILTPMPGFVNTFFHKVYHIVQKLRIQVRYQNLERFMEEEKYGFQKQVRILPIMHTNLYKLYTLWTEICMFCTDINMYVLCIVWM